MSLDACGSLIEVLSGKSFQRVLRARILNPRGMADTDFVVPGEKRGRFTPNYEQPSTTQPLVDAQDLVGLTMPWGTRGAAGSAAPQRTTCALP